MCKRMIHLFSLVLMVSQACNAVEVARWDFEETSGATATDQSGQYVATLAGGDTLDVDGKFGSGIDFAGDGGATVDVASSEAFRFTEDFSIVLWVNSDVAWGDYTRFVDISAADGGLADSYRVFTASGANADNVRLMTRQNGSNTNDMHTRDMAVGTWILLVVRHDLDGDVTLNVLQDGDSVDEAFVVANSESWPTVGSIVYAAGELKFGRLIGGSRKLDGRMDGVAFYDEVLTDAQVAAMFYTAGSSEFPLAAGPDPADGASLEATWGNLGWRAGDYAVSHDLYFGTSFDDVNDGAEATFVGNLATTRQVIGFAGFPAPEGLQPGTTYYWRVDEVNDANVASPWKGDVWSFSVPTQTAYNNSPADGGTNVLQDVTLNWTPGMGASLHHVYFGESLDEVSNAAGAIPQTDAIFTPAALEAEKTYYWRVDEFDSTGATYRGDVWSFTTVPDIAVADPDLQGWWTLDEGDGTTAVDWSGHGGHGGFVGDPQWADGYQGTALEFGGGEFVNCGEEAGSEVTADFTFAAWVQMTPGNAGQYMGIGGKLSRLGGNADYMGFALVRFSSNVFRLLVGDGDAANIIGMASSDVTYTDTEWHHVAGVREGQLNMLYVDGVRQAADNTTGFVPSDLFFQIGRQYSNTTTQRLFKGKIDDVRLYNKALTDAQIADVMLGDTKVAGSPVPGRDALADTRDISSLSWSKGDTASSHDVYLGTDRDAVAGADNTAPEFQGNQAGTSLSLAGLVEFGGGDFYWRIDELEGDGTNERRAGRKRSAALCRD